jgi:Domain of unknown function (DUF4861)
MTIVSGGAGVAAELGIWDRQTYYVSSNYRSARIITTRPIRSEFELTYEGWEAGKHKISETKRITIDAGSDMTRAESDFAAAPRTCMRRSDTACETAHCIVPPAGLIDSPSEALQKVVVASLCSRLASACTLPVIRVPSGDEPSPITSV